MADPLYIGPRVHLFTMGRVVAMVDRHKTIEHVAHVIGLATNTIGEVIIKIKREDGVEQAIHPGNLVFLEEHLAKA